MRDLQEQVQKLITYRIIEESLEPTDPEGGAYELYRAVDERISHFSEVFRWPVATEYTLEPTGYGDRIIRITNAELHHNYDPFAIPEESKTDDGIMVYVEGREIPNRRSPYRKDRQMLQGLYAIGAGKLAPAGGTKFRTIEQWVHRFGLLERTDPNPNSHSPAGHEPTVEQREITVSDFWLEAKNIRTLINVAYLISKGKVDKLVRWGRDLHTSDLEHRLCDFEKHLLQWAKYADRNPTLEARNFDGSLIPMMLALDLETRMQRNLENLNVGVSANVFGNLAPEFHPPSPGGMVLICRDLKSAVYAQLALVVSGQVALDYCSRPDCGKPMAMTRVDRKYCSDNCKSLESQRKREQNNSLRR